MMEPRRIKQLALIICTFLPSILQAQHAEHENMIHGHVFEEFDGHYYALPGANVHWAGTLTGTATDSAGEFMINLHMSENRLVTSFVGFANDTLVIRSSDDVNIVLESAIELEGVTIEQRIRSNEISFTDPRKTEQIDEEELTKAACCNLSESFETTPSVDVSFTDAVTGTRQIQMLGLAGPYSQLTQENMPGVRGLAAIQGLEYTPGAWVKSIQLSKGAGSVLNGFESTTGQINVELRKPWDKEKWFLNGYINGGGRFETNAITNYSVGKHWEANTLLHSKYDGLELDRNEDGFLDKPLGNNIILMQRFAYRENGWHIEAATKGLLFNRTAGQVGHQIGYEPDIDNLWGAKQTTKRGEGWAKIGKVHKDKPYQSVAIQLSGVKHDFDSYFGMRDYTAEQNSVYANLIYQSIIGNTNHVYKTGLSLQHDLVNEVYDGTHYWREEWVPGSFFEYTFTPSDKTSLVGGMRLDHHNEFGAFVTPRLHARHAFSDQLVVRASAGRGQRTASVFSENMGLMASSRAFSVTTNPASITESYSPIGKLNYYDLNPEIAWNYGVNATFEFELDYRPGRLSVDLYRTDFKQQIVVDYYSRSDQVQFYNLDGKSYANSFQIQLDYEAIRRLDVRLAYRLFDVQTDFAFSQQPKPLLAKHRGFINLAYHGVKDWAVDYTLQVNGEKPLPASAGSNLVAATNSPTMSPVFSLSNVQFSKTWKEAFELYLGVENLFNYRQENPIIGANDPFGCNFDAALIWGPIFGRMTYLGFRYKIVKA